MSGAVVRAVAGDADLAAWVEVHNRVSPTPISTGEARAWREALAAETHVLALADAEPVGAAFAWLDADSRRSGPAEAWIAVVPGARGGGIGAALGARLAGWARRLGVEALEGHVEEDDDESRAWARRRGFVEVGREARLTLDLRGLEPPPPAPPRGVRILTLAERPDVLRGLYDVACEAYPDIPGREDEEPEPFEDWLEHDMSGPGDDPGAVFVALAGGEVVGYSKFHLPQARPGVAVHDITGVRRAWRGRGVAGALKRTQVAWAAERGYERLETWNEERNLPIRRLNERLGYRLAPGRVLLRGPPFTDAPNAPTI